MDIFLIMEIQYYCYTRNIKLDYGDYLLPSNLSREQFDFVQKKILAVLSDDKIKLSIPKWMLIKFKDVLVWGVCGWNSLLSECHFKDHVGRPVYGFFAIVISKYSEENIKIPYDIKYFQQFYAERIAPYWNSRYVSNNPTSEFIEGNFNYIGATYNNLIDLLNTDIFQCQSLGELDKEKVVSAALALDNVSLLIDNDNIEQATNKTGAFMNCLSSAVAPGSHTVKQLCPKCKKYVTSYTDKGICTECKRKEDEIKQEEEDMDKQLKRDLEDANSKIQYLEYEIEEANKQIKKKNQLIKILLWISIILLLVLVFTCRDSLNFSTYMFGNKQNTETYQETIVTNNQNTSDDKISIEHED